MAARRFEVGLFQRALQLSLAAAVFAWGVTILPVAALIYRLDRASRAAVATMADGDDARLALLQRGLAGAFWWCPGPLTADRLLLATARTELALRGDDLAAQDARASEFEAAARSAIACSPQDGLAWVDLYWLQLRSEGLSARALAYLRSSHRFAPHEASVALIRSRLEIPILNRLPPDLQVEAISDLSGLVDARLEEQASDILGKLGLGQRAMLVAAVKRSVGRDAAAAFETALRRRKLLPEHDDGSDRFHLPFVQDTF